MCDLIINRGGGLYPHQLVEYVIPTGTFIDYGETYLYSVLGNSVDTHVGGHFYSQMEEKLFIVVDTSITMYNLNENTYESIATLPESVGYRSCLAANNDIIYVVGGRDLAASNSNNNTQVFDIESLLWMTNAPSMLFERVAFGCAVVNDVLWAIGGGLLETMETINTIDIASNSWEQRDDFPVHIHAFRIVVREQIIYCIGGYSTDLGGYSNTVYMIDTTTASVSQYAYSLPHKVNRHSSILVGNVIYNFGGTAGGGDYFDTWTTLELLSIILFKKSIEHLLVIQKKYTVAYNL